MSDFLRPFRTHSFLLPLISNILPFYDEICRRSINFLRLCFFHSSSLIRFIAHHGILYGNLSSFLRQNLYFCSNRFSCSVHNVLYCTNMYILSETFDDTMMDNARMLLELLLLRNSTLHCGFTTDEINCLINYLCTAPNND